MSNNSKRYDDFILPVISLLFLLTVSVIWVAFSYLRLPRPILYIFIGLACFNYILCICGSLALRYGNKS